MPVGAVPFPFGKCRICKDRATGVHYGVATCEGCKGFFKRSITKAEKYKCFFGGECEVTPKNRNRCKSCRFRLCLENGMSVEAVRMGRIPKIEKEKALEAVLSTDSETDPYTPATTSVDIFPRFSGPTETPYTGPGPAGPEIYDFDTGRISRQNRTVVDDSGRPIPETTTFPNLQTQRSLGGTVAPLIQEQQPLPLVAHGNNPVKNEFSDMGTSSCPFSQPSSKGTAMEIYECSKNVDNLACERNHSPTYQYSNTGVSSIDINNTYQRHPVCERMESVKRNETFGSSEAYQNHTSSRTESSTFTQDQLQFRTQHQKPHDNKPHRNPNHFSLVDTGCTYGQSPQLPPHEPSFYNHGREVHGNHDNHTATATVTLTSQSTSSYSQNTSRNSDHHLHYGYQTENRNTKIGGLKTEPVDMEVSDNFCDTKQTKPLYGSQNQLQKDLSMFEENSQNQAIALTNSQEVNDMKMSLAAEFVRPNSDRPGSVLSYPPTCPTPSSLDGSTTSSQRGRFGPGLIKVLLEQVLDSTQEQDIANRLKQRLEQNKMGKTVVSNVLNLIREVSAKRNKLAGSEETSFLTSTESSEMSSALSDSKMENIQRFLEDVSKFSKPLGSPPFINKPSISPNTSGTYDLNSAHLSADQNLHVNEFFDGKGKIKFSQSEHQVVTSALDELGQGISDKTLVKESTLKQKDQSSKIDSLQEVTLTLCEQSGKVGSSQTEFHQNSSETSCDLIDRTINENEVTCSDDKLSKEDVKKQVIQMTMEGLSVASKVLHRLKPEHREKLRLRKLGLIKIRAMTDSDEDIKECYKKIIDGIPHLNERILGFCEQVPGFSSINAEDRGLLMKRAYYDIWMLMSSEYFFDNEVNIILYSGDIYSRKPMEKILNKEMVNTLFDFANQFNSLHLSDLEVTILCAVRLTCSDDLEVKDKSTIKKLHSLMLDVLALEIEQNHPENHTRLLIDIFGLMPLLAIINKMQGQIIAKYRLDKPEQLEDENKTEKV